MSSEGGNDSKVPAWLDRDAYPFAVRFVELPVGSLHFLDEGQGPPVLMVHGTPTWSFDFRHLVRALVPARRCIAPDLLGFGLSDRPLAFAYTPDAHAAVISEFVDRLGLDRFAMVVHDFGGPIALPLALAGRVTRLVVINSWMWPLDEDAGLRRNAQLAGSPVGRWLYKYANASLRMLTPAAYGDRSKLTRALHRQLLEPFRRREDRALVLHALAKSLLRSREYYAGLLSRADRLKEIPVMVIWGMKDPALRPAQLERWQRLLPQSQVVRYPNAGHWPHEEEPGLVGAQIRQFLTRDP